MPDLYACRLPVGGHGRLAFDDVVAIVKDEVAQRSGMPAPLGGDTGAVQLAPGGEVHWQFKAAPAADDRLWTLRWEAPHASDGDSSWLLTANVGREGGATWVVVRLGVAVGGARMRPLRVDVEPPPIVLSLLERLPAEEDGRPLIPEPWYAPDNDTAGHLGELLLDPERVLPVVVVSSAGRPRGEPRPPAPLVDAEAIARSLAGIAHVVVLDSISASYALTDMLGPQLSAFGGAVRLYWPGITAETTPQDHPLWLPSQLSGRASATLRRALVNLLVPVALARFSAAPLEGRIRAAVERVRRTELEALWARAKEASLGPEWEEELDRAWKELKELRRENARLAAELATAQDNLRAMASRWRPHGEGPEPAEDDPDPGTIVEAVEVAARRSTNLVFLDDAFESARRATYRQPSRVLHALLALDGAVAAWRRNELPGGFRKVLGELGIDYGSAVSPVTAGRYPHEYERTWDGKRITLGPHIRLGRGSPEACCRIYLHLDDELRVAVVGHVGNHLSDRTTG